MATLNIQPSGASGKDTYIDASAQTTNYGSSTTIDVLGPASTKRILIEFDLSGIPSGAFINSATLRLYCTSVSNAGGQNVQIHRGLVSWVEAEATWQQKSTSVAWPGGNGGGSGTDYSASETSFIAVVGASADYDFNVLSDVSAYAAGSATNYGWWLITAGFRTKTFASSDNATAANRPELIIDYTETSIEGLSTGSSTVTGSLFGTGNLVGSISAQAIVVATLISNEYIRGDVQGLATISAILKAVGHLLGQSLGSSLASGDIQGEILLAPGLAEGTSTVFGDIKGVYYLNGESLGSSSASATGSFEGQLRGFSYGSAAVSALGYAKAVNVVDPQNCIPLPLFHMTDGSVKNNGQLRLVDFISDKSGYMLKEGWQPAVSQYKDGGRWANSPLAQGRRLKGRVFDNAIEILDLSLVGYDQNRAIRYLHDLFEFQEGVADYWSSVWSSLPFYLVSRAAKETNTRYAIIHMISCPQLQNLYAQPFFDSNRAVFDSLTLRIERGHWSSTPPGEFECVPISSIRSWTVAGWQSGS